MPRSRRSIVRWVLASSSNWLQSPPVAWLSIAIANVSGSPTPALPPAISSTSSKYRATVSRSRGSTVGAAGATGCGAGVEGGGDAAGAGGAGSDAMRGGGSRRGLGRAAGRGTGAGSTGAGWATATTSGSGAAFSARPDWRPSRNATVSSAPTSVTDRASSRARGTVTVPVREPDVGVTAIQNDYTEACCEDWPSPRPSPKGRGRNRSAHSSIC